MTGMQVPDLKGAKPEKIPGLVEKFRKEQIYIRDNPNNTDNTSVLPLGSDSCEACGKMGPKGSLNHDTDKAQNYHLTDAIVSTKDKHIIK